MDIQKIFIYLAIAFVGLFMWSEWQKESPLQEGLLKSKEAKEIVSNAYDKAKEIVPQILQNDKTKSDPKKSEIKKISKIPQNRIIEVSTDVLALKIDKLGGKIVEAKLLKYLKSAENKDPYLVFNHKDDNVYYATSNVTNVKNEEDGEILFSSKESKISLDNSGKAGLVLESNNNGLFVKKTFTLHKGSYKIDNKITLANNSKNDWEGKGYWQLTRKDAQQKTSFFGGASSYVGASMSDPSTKIYEKISFSSMDKTPLNKKVKAGWIAMQERYFLSAWIPQSANNTFYSHVYDGLYTIGFASDSETVKPGGSKSFDASIYVGPEKGEQLIKAAPGLDLTIDYGWLWFISGFLFKVLSYIHKFVGNWGWSIILLTLMIKLAFYHLSAASYKSMANLRKFQPKIQAIKERYADDRQQQSAAMMELYKKEKINPVGGCLPILIQIPVFISLYWVLLESVELRQAPFIFWWVDLSAKDPFYVLPIIMGASMLLQQKMSPPPPDPTQAKVMMLMPVFFTFIFLNMPSGLVLYWVVNNLLSISQQWYITKKFAKA